MYKTRLLFLALIFGFLSMSAITKKRPSAKSAMKVLNGFCEFIPSGSVSVDGESISVQSFYMSKGEITNFQYIEFLYYLKNNNETEKYAVAAVDTNRWNTAFEESYLVPMASLYHSHPSFYKYPVVNISKEAAILYCEWLTGMYRDLSGGEMNLQFRVPTHAEWLRAANGDMSSPTYSWGGPMIKNAKGNDLANYLELGSEDISRDEETGEFVVTKPSREHHGHHFFAAPSESYSESVFGLYNMNGNVAEMISDGDFAVGGDWNSPGYDIRNQSIKKFEGTHPTVGFRIVATYFPEGGEDDK